MIDHISIAVRDLRKAERFYEALLAPLGMTRVREWPMRPSASARNIPNSGSTERAAA